MDDKERITMAWPAGLKDRIRAHTGNRGITEFTVAAINQRLDGLANMSTLGDARCPTCHYPLVSGECWNCP